MRQTAKIIRCHPDGTADIAVTRRGACAGDCDRGCGGCAAEQTLLATVQNPIAARPGELVWVETPASGILGAAAAVYLLPVFSFLGAYAAARAAGLPEWACLGLGAGGFAAAGGFSWLLNRRVQRRGTAAAVVTARRDEAGEDG